MKTKKEQWLEENNNKNVGSAAIAGAALGGLAGGWGGALIGFIVGSALDSSVNDKKKEDIIFRRNR